MFGKRIWAAAAGIAATICFSVQADAAARVGQPAPAFSLTTFSKQKVRLADLRGKVVVINHWATWCGPCKSEMPMMSAFHRRFKSQGLEIFGVTTEDSVSGAKLKRVADALSYPLVSKFSGNAYPWLGGLPTSYVIDRKGIVRYAGSGAFDLQEFARIILPLLAEPAPTGAD
jgi:peroxiredoxin